MIARFVRLGAELGDDFAVDLDAALGDELFGMAATGDACPSEDLLEALELGRRGGVSSLWLFLRLFAVCSASLS
jgi:hypothetical protein